MSDYEILKECKVSYENIYDMLENCPIISDEDTKTRDNLHRTLTILEDIYQNAWELMAENNDTHEQLKKSVKCPRCHNKMMISDLIGYAYVCNECDENYYYTECQIDYTWWLDDNRDYLRIAISDMIHDYLNNTECENDEEMKAFEELEKDDLKISEVVNKVLDDDEVWKELDTSIKWYVNKAIGGEL